LQGSNVLSIRLSTNDSNLALVSLRLKCFGPVLSAVINGKLISVCVADDNSHFAFSAASLTRCSARLSFFKSTPESFFKLVYKVVN
jgi:hypothetical protein